MVKSILLAAVIGALVTFLLLGMAFTADHAGFASLAHVLFWQNSLLQSLVPMGDIGTPGHQVHEGSPLNLIAFSAAFPVGVAVYGVVAFVLIHRRGRRM